MRRMMAGMLLLGLAGLSSANGQRRPARVQSEYVSSDSDALMRLSVLGVPSGSGPEAAKTDAGGTVSVQELKVPDKALKEVRQSDKALLAGDLHASTEHLEQCER